MSGPKSKPKTSGKKKAAVAPKRDNFNSLTWHKLRDSAGNVCSFPGCHVHTHGASSDGEGTVGIGVACHIKAAAPGGPRYDEHQTTDQRKHFDNGIWMCQTHSKLIDADDSAYSVETLVEWKQKAEARSNSLINQKSFTESEVKAAVEEGTVSVLQRWVNKCNDPFDTPIAEVFEGYESGLASLDPRFNVQVDKVGKSYHHFISAAQENVSLQLILKDLDQLEGFWEAERALFEEGRQLEIPGAHFKFEGSKLFDAIHQRTHRSGLGVLTVGAPKRALTANLYVRSPDGHERAIDRFTCYYTSGSVRTVFNGTALGGFFAVKATCAHDGSDTKFDLTFNVDAWRDKNILDLPGFSRLARAAQNLGKGRLVVEIEVGNNVASFDTKSSPINEEYHDQLRWLIEYLDLARKVAEQCSEAIFLKNLDFDHEVYSILRKYAGLIDGPYLSTRQPGLLSKGQFDSQEKCDFSGLKTGGLPPVITVAQRNSVSFELFGQAITPPRIETLYTGIELVAYTDLETPSQPKAEFYTTEGSTVTMQLQSGDPWIVHEDLSVLEEPLELNG
ncbi:hypothetical protein EC849_107109 [Pseudomonas putida]|uniref:hypothetical protein n=1 Tax=Pseudomonas putida TaxID=303 RepID=UPI001043F12D|nr:hypothetical protein [Pseudomonas putida]TCP75846.1 hypothetical protein EC849_107109 [Pseudomonas putida]